MAARPLHGPGRWTVDRTWRRPVDSAGWRSVNCSGRWSLDGPGRGDVNCSGRWVVDRSGGRSVVGARGRIVFRSVPQTVSEQSATPRAVVASPSGAWHGVGHPNPGPARLRPPYAGSGSPLTRLPAVPSRRPGVARSGRSRGATVDASRSDVARLAPRDRSDSPSGGRRDGTPGAAHHPPANARCRPPSRRPACPARAMLRSRGVLRVVAARRRLCRAAGPGRQPACPPGPAV